MINKNIKFHPILFSTPMVQAILEVRKTMTRRIVKMPPRRFDHHLISNKFFGESGREYKCPYGKVGDVLWVRETFILNHIAGVNSLNISFKAGTAGDVTLTKQEWYKFFKWKRKYGVWHSSLFMFKSMCRIFLEITNIKVERLHDISKADAINEGIEPVESFDSGAGISTQQMFKNYLPAGYTEVLPKDSFQSLWQSINGKESWEVNPFVWVIEFKQIEKPENFK